MRWLGALALLSGLVWLLSLAWRTWRTTRAAEQKARQARMQAVRDEWVCRELLRLPESTEAND